jgi:hypothetical protein
MVRQDMRSSASSEVCVAPAASIWSRIVAFVIVIFVRVIVS